jgi:histidine ammonia-lyase
MGANSATSCYRVFENMEKVFGIELLTAFQGLDFRENLKSSEKIKELHTEFRKTIKFIETDVELQLEMKKAIEFLKNL